MLIIKLIVLVKGYLLLRHVAISFPIIFRLLQIVVKFETCANVCSSALYVFGPVLFGSFLGFLHA